jgi:hypothetical protein
MFEALRVDYGMLGPFGDHPEGATPA